MDYFEQRGRPTQKDYNEVVECRLYDYGHRGYTGSFAENAGAITFPNVPPFETADEAYCWLDENCEKWQPGMAVPVKNGDWVVGALCSE